MLIIYAGTNGYLDPFDVSDVLGATRRSCSGSSRRSAPAILNSLARQEGDERRAEGRDRLDAEGVRPAVRRRPQSGLTELT